MHYNYHLIKNFPKNYPFYKKILANLIFCIGRTIIHRRKNFLTKQDRAAAEKLLHRGDIVLVGGLRRFSSLIIKGPITHAMLYVGKKRFVHAVCDGVETDSLPTIFREYDTMIILRPKRGAKRSANNLASGASAQGREEGTLSHSTPSSSLNKAINFALSKIGTPFDFEFKRDKKKVYCSELIMEAYASAGIPTGIKNRNGQIHPHLFINSHFSVIFHSQSLGNLL